jgi:hypothetical protein
MHAALHGAVVEIHALMGDAEHPRARARHEGGRVHQREARGRRGGRGWRRRGVGPEPRRGQRPGPGRARHRRHEARRPRRVGVRVEHVGPAADHHHLPALHGRPRRAVKGLRRDQRDGARAVTGVEEVDHEVVGLEAGLVGRQQPREVEPVVALVVVVGDEVGAVGEQKVRRAQRVEGPQPAVQGGPRDVTQPPRAGRAKAPQEPAEGVLGVGAADGLEGAVGVEREGGVEVAEEVAVVREAPVAPAEGAGEGVGVLLLEGARGAAEVAHEDGRREALPLAEHLGHRVLADGARVFHHHGRARGLGVPREAPAVGRVVLLGLGEGAQGDGGRRRAVEAHRHEPRGLVLAPPRGGRRGLRRGTARAVVMLRHHPRACVAQGRRGNGKPRRERSTRRGGRSPRRLSPAGAARRA